MKNIIAIILIIVGWSEALSQDTPTLTVSGTTYDLIADRNFDVGTSVAYAEGYEEGRASNNGTITMNFVTDPAMSIYHNNGTYELLFEYEVDVIGADKLYDSNGNIPAFVYIEFLNRVNHGSSSDGQWHRPVFRLVFAYEYQFGNAVQGPDIIATSYTGGVNSLPNFVRDLITPATRATHARITIQHHSGVTLHRIIPITLWKT